MWWPAPSLPVLSKQCFPFRSMLYHNTQHAGAECNNGFFFTFFRFLRVFPRSKRFYPIQGGVLGCTSWERFFPFRVCQRGGIAGFTNANGVTFFPRSQNGVNLRPILGVWGLSRNVPYGRQGLEGPAWPLRHPEHGQITKNVLFCFVPAAFLPKKWGPIGGVF